MGFVANQSTRVAKQLLYRDQDRWPSISRSAGQRCQHPVVALAPELLAFDPCSRNTGPKFPPRSRNQLSDMRYLWSPMHYTWLTVIETDEALSETSHNYTLKIKRAYQSRRGCPIVVGGEHGFRLYSPAG